MLVRNGIPAAVIDWTLLRNGSILSAKLDGLLAAAANLRISYDESYASNYRPLLAAILIVDPDFLVPRSRLEVFAERIQRLVSDGLLDCACLLDFDPATQNFIDFNQSLAFDRFAMALRSHMDSPGNRPVGEAGDAVELGRLLSSGDVSGLVEGITSTPAGLSAAEAAVVSSRRRVVAELQALAKASDTTETMMHQMIGDNYWIFGGRYINIAPRRDFAFLDQHDYPLLCADGSIQIVELKGPECPLVTHYRNHFIVTKHVHEATSQCLNYLRSLDEQGSGLQTTYRNEFNIDIDFRRARGTVVIGHLDREAAGAAERFQIVQTIRSYNAHLSRIEVITYSELLDSADRALRFEAMPR